MRILKIIALAMFIAATPIALWVGVRWMPSIQNIAPPTAIEVMATVFGAITIVLGVLAIVIAGLAIWGYGAIKTEAKQAAQVAALSAAEEYFKGKAFDDKLKEKLTPASRPEVNEEAVAREYPKEGGKS